MEGTGGGGEFTDPLLTWSTAEASPSGAAILAGSLWVAALRGERVWRVPLTGAGDVGTPEALFTGEFGRLRAAEAAASGTIWVTTSNRDGRGDPIPEDDGILEITLGEPAPTTPSRDNESESRLARPSADTGLVRGRRALVLEGLSHRRWAWSTSPRRRPITGVNHFEGGRPRSCAARTAARPSRRAPGARYSSTRFARVAPCTVEMEIDWSKVTKRPSCRVASASR